MKRREFFKTLGATSAVAMVPRLAFGTDIQFKMHDKTGQQVLLDSLNMPNFWTFDSSTPQRFEGSKLRSFEPTKLRTFKASNLRSFKVSNLRTFKFSNLRTLKGSNL